MSRLNGRIGSVVNLDVTFFKNGVPADPFAIRRIDIFEGSVKEENIVAQVLLPDPDDANYPLPLQTVSTSPGFFSLPFSIPLDFAANEVYFDVWKFIGPDPGTDGIDLTDETLWLEQCNKFFVFPEAFFLDDGLTTVRLGFEPLDNRLRKGEVRTIEVGIMPLPLYDFDFNKIAPLIPQLIPTISIETDKGELIAEDQPGRMGLRQGSFRSNPFVAQFTIDSNEFIKGTYLYRVTLQLPNGETRTSDDLRLSIV